MISKLSQWLWHLYGWGHDHRRLLLALFIVSRLTVLVPRITLLVGSSKHFDFRHHFELAQMSAQGLYPYVHYWVEYPPLFPWLAVAAYRLGALLTSGPTVEFVFYLLIGGLMVAAETGTLVLISLLAKEVGGREAAWRSLLLYALLFVPTYLWQGWFDTLPTFLFLLSLSLLIKQRERLSAMTAGLGIAAKVFPALLVPLAVCVLPGLRRKAMYALIAAAVVAAIVLPHALTGSEMVWVSLRAMLSRPSWETIWAVLEGYYGPGIVAGFAERLDPATATAGIHPSTLPWGPITAAFAALYLLFYRRLWGEWTPRQVAAAAGATLGLLLLYAKGYSPQYLAWLAPLLVVVFANWRGALYLGGLTLLNLAEYPGYFHFFPNVHGLLVAVVTARTVLLAIITVHFWREALARYAYRH